MSQIFYDLLKRIKNFNETDNQPTFFFENGGIDVTSRAELGFDLGFTVSQRETHQMWKTRLSKS